jgi:5-methyltetrahydropteroyltriglutamate--homocysteine methyltransferase
MKRSENRIITSHAGSLPRPDDLLQMNRDKQTGKPIDEAARTARIKEALPEVVRKQAEAGIDVVNDGEYGKTNFLFYVNERLGGFEASGDFEHRGALARNRRDRSLFPEFYEEALATPWNRTPSYACVGPVTYTGQALLQADLDNFKQALQGVKYEEAFMTALAPNYASENRYYKTQEEYEIAVADALSVEYKAIVDAGFALQIDDPGLPSQWDGTLEEPSLEDYRKRCARRVELVNYALRDIPQDRVRYHICWGSWHGPHVTDIPLRDIVGLLLDVNAECYSVEAANARHEHEWKVWREVKLPDGKTLMPGVVSHATNVVEHPELVADRIIRYAEQVGRERVIAGTDCGMGGRIHPTIAWAKLKALSEGAMLASKQLW